MNKFILSGALRLLSVLFSFLFFVLISRHTSPDDFGAFSYIFSIALILSYCLNMGQHVAILRLWPQVDIKNGRSCADHLLLISFLIVVVASLVGALFVLGLIHLSPFMIGNGPDINFIYWIIPISVAMAFAEFFSSALRARGFIIFSLAPRDILWRILVVAFVYLGPSSLDLTSVLNIVLISLLVCIFPQLCFVVVKLFRSLGSELSSEIKKDLIKSTPSLWLSTSTSPILDHALTIVVAIALGPVEAGIFFAADRLSKLLGFFLVSMETVIAPDLSRSFLSGSTRSPSSISISAAIFATIGAISGFVFYTIFGDYILGIFGDGFQSYTHILLILSLGVVVNSACGPNSMALNMAGLHNSLLLIRLFWAVETLVFGYFMSIYYGIAGAATSLTISTIGWNLCASLVLSKKINVSTSIFAASRDSWLRILRGKIK